jgi:hypothetical protein
VHGPLGSLVPLANQLLKLPYYQCPVLALWMTEGLPRPTLPGWLLRPIGALRSSAERMAYREDAQDHWVLDARWRLLAAKACRFRYYGDIHWLDSARIPFLLAVGSDWIAQHLRNAGLSPVVAYIGCCPEWYDDLRLDRDVPVLWLGKITSGARRRHLTLVREQLADRGVKVHMVDGIENPYVFGNERTVLLNRSRVVLNLMRNWWDNNGVRYCLAAPNRALIASEPALPHTPFVPGVHLVASPVEKLADAICHHLSHEAERQRIVERAYQLVTTELSMERGVSRVLAEAAALPREMGFARSA